MLNEIDGKTISLSAINDITHEFQMSDKQMEKVRARKIGDTVSLASVSKLKFVSQVMLTRNINVEDKWTGKWISEKRKKENAVKVMHVKLDD